MDFFEQMEQRIPHGARSALGLRPAPPAICTSETCAPRSIPGSSPAAAGGKFILRIEDTDQGRLVEGATDVIYNTLAQCGLDHDEGPDVGGPVGPYIQSERRDLYRQIRTASH